MPFLMAGDPDLDTTRSLLRGAVEAGADLIELGVPFSDPTADGPVLQRSAGRALQRGTSLARILEMVTELRADLSVPIVLFGYYNPIFHYGPARLAEDARRAGVDGLLVVDLPPEEADELWRPARAAGLDMIFLLAPTSDSRRGAGGPEEGERLRLLRVHDRNHGNQSDRFDRGARDGGGSAPPVLAPDRRRIRHQHAPLKPLPWRGSPMLWSSGRPSCVSSKSTAATWTSSSGWGDSCASSRKPWVAVEGGPPEWLAGRVRGP